mgnify:CR=1 FL=1
MSLTKVDAVKINQYLNQHGIGDIYYQDMVEVLGKKNKPTDTEFLEFFTESIMSELKKDTKILIGAIIFYILILLFVVMRSLFSMVNV